MFCRCVTTDSYRIFFSDGKCNKTDSNEKKIMREKIIRKTKSIFNYFNRIDFKPNRFHQFFSSLVFVDFESPLWRRMTLVYVVDQFSSFLCHRWTTESKENVMSTMFECHRNAFSGEFSFFLLSLPIFALILKRNVVYGLLIWLKLIPEWSGYCCF